MKDFENIPTNPKPSSPMSGLPGTLGAAVPPPSIPFHFFIACGIGLVAFGVALAISAEPVLLNPTGTQVIAVVHLGLLAFLSTLVLGALHQFGPVLGSRPLRSIKLAKVSFWLFVIGAWGLPLGFSTGIALLVSIAGAVATTGVGIIVWNLSGPLSSKGKGVPAAGVRWSLTFLVITVCFGMLYALDRENKWFLLLPHIVLAHAQLGLIGWIGLTYIAVSEKLLPMFLLAHRPTAGLGAWAIRLIPFGLLVLTPGLVLGISWIIAIGALILISGLVAHVGSLMDYMHRRHRRKFDFYQGFLLISASFLILAILLAVTGALAHVPTSFRTHLIEAEIVSITGWLSIASIGQLHKVVPFISWGLLRSKGLATKSNGKQLLFADLFEPKIAWFTLIGLSTSFSLLDISIVTVFPQGITTAGVILSIVSLITMWNLGLGPKRALQNNDKGSSPSKGDLSTMRTIHNQSFSPK